MLIEFDSIFNLKYNTTNKVRINIKYNNVFKLMNTIININDLILSIVICIYRYYNVLWIVY